MTTESLMLRRTFDAPVARVFQAWENPEILARWFSPPGWAAEATSDFRVGGVYRIHMADGSGATHTTTGEYREIEPGRRMVFTWTCIEIGVSDSVVTVDFEPRGETTEVTLVHVLPPDAELVRLHTEGWVRCLTQLAVVLEEVA